MKSYNLYYRTWIETDVGMKMDSNVVTKRFRMTLLLSYRPSLNTRQKFLGLKTPSNRDTTGEYAR